MTSRALRIDRFYCALCGERIDLVVGRYCNDCQKFLDREEAEILLSDELSELVTRLAEFAVAQDRLVDREAIQRAITRLDHATGAATTRQRMIELAAIVAAAAAQIPVRHHTITEEDRERARRDKHARGHQRSQAQRAAAALPAKK